MRMLVAALVLAAVLLEGGDAGPLKTRREEEVVEPIGKVVDDVDKTAYNSNSTASAEEAWVTIEPLERAVDYLDNTANNSDAADLPISIGLRNEFSISEEGSVESTETPVTWANGRNNNSEELRVWDGWLYGGLAEGMLGFGLESEDPRCARDGRLYRQHLDNLTLWAVRMFDSSAVSANGLLSADGFQFGHFDECVAIEADGPQLAITGKYCLATIKLGPDPRHRARWYDPPQKLYSPLPATAHAWDRMKMSDDPRQLRRDVLRWAVCVPSSCSARDVGHSLSRSLAPPLARRGVRSEVTVTTDDCYSVWEAPPFPAGYYVVIGLMYFMFFICIICTFVEYSITEETKMRFSLHKLVKVFSMYSNMRKLVKSKPKAEFKLVHFLKFMSIVCVILGHKEMYLFGNPVQNTEFIETFYSYWTSMLFLNGGNYIVDVFFVLSGFLTCHFMVRELDKRKSINLPMAVIGKALKILPVYAFVLAFHATVLPYLGSGPLWNQLVWREALRCQKNWWTNMLFLNNYVNADDMCMIQSWYLACDMHFFIVGLILITIRHRHRSLGNALIASALAFSIAVPMYITYVNQYWGTVRTHHHLQIDPVKVEHFLSMYVPSHTRFIPYMVGLVMSYVSQHLANIGFKYSVPWLVFLVPFAVFVNLTTTFVAYVFYVEERPYDLFENVFYSGACRVLWALTVVNWLIIDSTGGMGKWSSIFRHRAWAPLGRLTYCVFLVHTIPMLYLTGVMRSAPYHTRTMAALTMLEELGISFFLALFINIIIESPLERVLKMALKSVIGGPPKTDMGEKNLQQVAESQLTLALDGSKDKLSSTITLSDGPRIRYRDENGVYKG